MSDDRSVPAGDQGDLFRQFPLALARIIIGWHFLYEGFTKLTDANWTAAGYLQGSTGPLAGFFQSRKTQPSPCRAASNARGAPGTSGAEGVLRASQPINCS